MKNLLTILLFTCISHAQTIVSFHYGTANSAGAEILTPVNDSFWLGGGFGGALNPDRSKDNERWCDIYAVSSFGYIGPIMIKEKAGISTTTSDYGRVVKYKPLIGIGAMYAVSKNYGIEIGADNFNGLTIGFCAIF